VTPASARTLASRLLTKVDVLDRIAELRAELFRRLDLTAEDVIRELMLVGFSDVGHYRVNEVTGALELAPGVEAARSRALASVKHRSRTGGHGDDTWTEHTVEYRLWDKVAALTKLGEHLGLWRQSRAGAGRTEVVLAPDGSVHIITAGDA
jgi:phage terminase small subunit